MRAYFKLFRGGNILIIILLQYLLKTAVFEKQLIAQGINLPNLDLWFALLVASTVFVAIAGYLANDIADIAIDKINRPSRVLVTGEVSLAQARILQKVFEFMGIILGLIVAINVENYSLVAFHIFIIVLMRAYSSWIKCKGFLGNITVALSSAAVPALVWVFFIFSLQKAGFYAKVDNTEIRLITTFYIGFAFVFTLIREFVKDLEDLKGDRECGCKTLATLFALQKSKNLVIILSAIAIQGILLFQWILYNSLPNSEVLGKYGTLFMANFVSIIIVVMFQVIFKTITANSSYDFHKIGTSLKIIMLAGILQMLFLLC